jgi:hypothetical protein
MNQKTPPGATKGEAAARRTNSFGAPAPPAAAQGGSNNRPTAGTILEQGGAAHTAPDNNLGSNNPGNKLTNPFSVPDNPDILNDGFNWSCDQLLQFLTESGIWPQLDYLAV